MMLGTQAKRPGLQAGYEKAMAGAFGVLTGCDDLHYVGVMSFDDIFSPEQMVADLELRDALERLRRGMPPEDPDGWLDDIREGVERGYVQADATLDHYKETYWFPRLFDRRAGTPSRPEAGRRRNAAPVRRSWGGWRATTSARRPRSKKCGASSWRHGTSWAATRLRRYCAP